MLDRHQPDAVIRRRLLDATIALVAADGVRAVNAASVTSAASVERSAVTRYFGSCDQLLLSAALLVTRRTVLPVPRPLSASRSTISTLTSLAEAHRGYVDRSPERFAAILQLSSAALFGTPQILAPLAARTAKARAAAEAHLTQLQSAGRIRPGTEISLIAAGFVDAMTGIEICHIIDQDATIRDDGYRGLCAMTDQIAGARSD